jgi:5-methylcytosine-specific restriction endonuclease McrA
MAKKETSLKTWLIPKLRRLSYQWPSRRLALVRARVSRGLYECAECKREGRTGLWGPKEISMDHIEPVVDLNGWDSWDDVLARLFCSPDDFQCLCHDCHDKKTEKENQVRKEQKIKKKKLDNDDDI